MLASLCRAVTENMHSPQPTSSSEAAGDDRRHAVHFYERDEELASKVAQFVAEGLRAGEAAIVVASEGHRQLYIDRLRALNIDIETALAAGTLTILDAAETLKTLMVGDRPDAERFNRVAGSRIEALCTRGGRWTKVRAFGEMVDLLWRGGNRAAALALEELWNELVARYPVDLLCAYALPGFYDGPHPMEQVCAGHSEVSTAVAVGNAVAPETGGAVATQMRALAAEIAHRKQVEQMLRGAVRELRQAEKAERERAERNDRLVQELSDTVRVNELFMGVLAHDLRAPLAAIMTAAQLMKIRDTSDSRRNAKALGRLLNSGERMSRMIEQLLDFTRLRVGGGIALETKKGDIATLARQVVDELEGSYPELPRGDHARGRHGGAWDADRLSQVLSNLVANALSARRSRRPAFASRRRATRPARLRAGAQHGRDSRPA